MTFLRWLFESFWHFLGVFLLIALCGEVVADVVRAARGPKAKGGA